MQIADKKVVGFHFKLTNDKGELIDSSEDHPAMMYIHGQGNILPGLEKVLTGKEEGDNFTLTLQPAEGYGERDENLVKTMPRDEIKGTAKIGVGTEFEVEFPSGSKMVTVTAIEGGNVTIDGNHPLAGEVLTFEIDVAEVREPTSDELTHGHVHGPGGAH
ncbi:MAG: peptidylprolyl isomerase [Chloroflexi bacterium]|nr:peptidylprolyl isomerase [Chloroflexota bacterium]